MHLEMGAPSTGSRPQARGLRLPKSAGRGAVFVEYAMLVVFVAVMGFLATKGFGAQLGTFFTLASNGL